MINYEFETVGQCFDEIVRLGAEHDAEVNWAPETYVLDPSWDMYHTLEEAGVLQVLVARDHGRPVGYIAATLIPHLNYQQLKVGTILAIFAKREVRASGVGYRLLRKMQERLESGGAGVIHVYVPISSPALKRLLDRRGFNLVEEQYEWVTQQPR